VKWLRIKRAEIDPEFREMFEARGLDTVRAYVAVPGFNMRRRDGTLVTEREMRPAMQMWLKEQYDRADRKETWSLAMEISITFLVAAELLMSVIAFFHGKPK
jgi:hypothetical protein